MWRACFSSPPLGAPRIATSADRQVVLGGNERVRDGAAGARASVRDGYERRAQPGVCGASGGDRRTETSCVGTVGAPFGGVAVWWCWLPLLPLLLGGSGGGGGGVAALPTLAASVALAGSVETLERCCTETCEQLGGSRLLNVVVRNTRTVGKAVAAGDRQKLKSFGMTMKPTPTPSAATHPVPHLSRMRARLLRSSGGWRVRGSCLSCLVLNRPPPSLVAIRGFVWHGRGHPQGNDGNIRRFTINGLPDLDSGLFPK